MRRSTQALARQRSGRGSRSGQNLPPTCRENTLRPRGTGRTGAGAFAGPQSPLLGTGGPEPEIDRFGPATLVEAGTEKLLFDAGRGVTQRLWQLGVRLGEVNALFLTHLHSDHVVGIPDLWLTGWMRNRFGQRMQPLSVRGPRGTNAMMVALSKAYDADIQQRTAASALPVTGIAVDAHDVVEGVFDRAKPKLAVYTHIGLVAGPARRSALLGALVTRTRTAYNGALEVGEDLMTITVGDKVEVRRVTSGAR